MTTSGWAEDPIKHTRIQSAPHGFLGESKQNILSVLSKVLSNFIEINLTRCQCVGARAGSFTTVLREHDLLACNMFPVKSLVKF